MLQSGANAICSKQSSRGFRRHSIFLPVTGQEALLKMGAVIEDAGAQWTDLVDVLVFLTDMDRDFKTYNRVYAEYFAGEGNPNPTRTTIEINCLPTPIAVEVKAVACMSG